MKKRLLAMLLASTMVFGLAACGGSTDSGKSGENTDTQQQTEEGEEPVMSETPLVVGYSPFNAKFSPFFAETAYDQDVQKMTNIALLDTDREGAVVYNGIEGETRPYNGTDYTYQGASDCVVTTNDDGTVFYDFTLRDGITFSDGEPVTIDDVIFSLYVRCDPTYDGSATLFSQPIEGMEAYRSGMSKLFDLIYAAGEDNTDFTYWDEAKQTAFWSAFNSAKEAFGQSIADYCIANGYNEEGASIADCAANWGYQLDADATAADFFDKMMENYGGDVAAMTDAEKADKTFSDLMDGYQDYQVGVTTGDSAPSITGIQKTGDNSLRIVATEVAATLIYQLAVEISPMHYYGSKDLYDYDNNKFGFEKGDLSSVRAKTTEPLGAGPYVFKKYENGVVNFEANTSYYLGCPKIKYLNFREVQDVDKLNGVINGEIDVTDPSFSKDTAKAIAAANSNGEVSGDVIVTSTVDNLGYGYIGLNSNRICVGDKPDSDASKNLRRGLATVLAVYRDVANDSYYGEAAEVINYPISNTSWAAPRPTDSDYRVAFSTDVDGNDIYTSDMDADAKYEAAKKAALGFFEAAGYTVKDGKVTKAPEGAKMEYEVMIPGDGSGDHPAFMILTEAKKAFEEIGINLIINDLTDSSQLWDGLSAHTVDMWTAAWGATVDPDMYQIYYSDVANGGKNPGGSNYMYQIEDEELDKLILDARASLDQDYRKAVYKAALDKVIDWAVEIPNYQRQNAIIFSAERVNIDTVTPDITTFYGWMAEIQNIEMK